MTVCARSTVVLFCLVVLSACSTPTGSGSASLAFSLPDTGVSLPDTASSPPSACASACPAHTGSTAACSGGQCVYTCDQGRLDCNGLPADGCEVDSSKDPKHCGTCDKACPATPNATAKCSLGHCGQTCDLGWSDCLAGSDGCETETGTDITHCGDCTTVCKSGPHATPQCTDGGCSLTCDGGFADCNGLADDGCEADTVNDPEHCGSCGISCKGAKCVKGACECASTTQTATQMPLDMYIMMDQSGSMGDPTGTGASKWDAIAQAISAFANDANSTGIGVGIQYFPIVKGGLFSSKDSCTASDYAKPEIAIAPLPGNANAIIASVANHGPGGSTPTSAALQGAVNYAKSFAAANPTHTVVVVFATDGEPTECKPQDITSIAAIAAGAAANAPKVMTFVVGVGASLNLDAIAAGGGSKQAFKVDEGGNVVLQFEAALKAIQGQALGCTYSIPQPAKGQPVDPKKVNVQLTLAGGVPTVLKYNDTPAQCGAEGGWYYDDPANPTKIILCPATCTVVSGDKGPKVDILLGCARASATP